MNWLLFFTLIAWVGAVGGLLLGGLNFVVWYYYNFHTDGVQEAHRHRILTHQEYKFPRMVPAIVVFILCTIFLVTKAFS